MATQSHRHFTTSGPSTSVTNYNNLSSLIGSWTGNETAARCVAATAGVIQNLSLRVTNSPGSGKSYLLTLRIGGVDTGLTLTLADTNTTATSNDVSVLVAPGDLLTVSSVPSGTPAGWGQDDLGWEFIATNARESTYINSNQTQNTTSTLRNGVFSDLGSVWTATAANVTNVVPIAGSLTQGYVQLDSSPGAGKSYTFQFYKNGTLQDGTGGTVDTRIVISDSATSGNLSYNLALNPGDTVYTECVPAGTPTGRAASYSYTFTAVRPQEAILCGFSNNNPSTAGAQFNDIEDNANWSSTEGFSINQVIGGVTTFKVGKLYILLSVAPGGATSYTFDIRVSGASPTDTPSVTVTGAATTGNDKAQFTSVTSTDTWGIRSVPASTPASTRVSWGMSQRMTSSAFSVSGAAPGFGDTPSGPSRLRPRIFGPGLAR